MPAIGLLLLSAFLWCVGTWKKAMLSFILVAITIVMIIGKFNDKRPIDYVVPVVVPTIPIEFEAVIPVASTPVMQEINTAGVVTKFEEVDPLAGQPMTIPNYAENQPSPGSLPDNSRWCEVPVTTGFVAQLTVAFGPPVVYEADASPQYRFGGGEGTLIIDTSTLIARFEVAGHLLSPVEVDIARVRAKITWILTGSPCAFAQY